MPASITHAIFAIDVLDSLSNKEKNILDSVVNQYKLYAQGSDCLLFLLQKKHRKLQRYFHTNDTDKYFWHLCNYIKKNNYTENSQLIAYLYGNIAHYVLDSNCHPFVIYKSGKKNKNKHSFMEAYIDMYMVKKKFNVNPYKFNFYNFIFKNHTLSEEVKNAMRYTYLKAYHLNNIVKLFSRGFSNMAYSQALLRKDSYGVKKNIYKLIDTFTFKNNFRLETVSYHVNLDTKRDLLNNKHDIWYNPFNKNLTYNDSFDDIYNKAIYECVSIINEVRKYFNNERSNLEDVFSNKSYVTGLNCNYKKNK